MRNFFISDWHLDHDVILKITDRPFANVEEHNDTLLRDANKRVGENDRLFLLGDMAWRTLDSYLAKLRCKNVHLIVGNHDKANFGKHCKSVADVMELKILGHTTFLSHYPHAFWPASHRGSLHLYGHLHDAREEWLDEKLGKERRSMDVSVDTRLRLFKDCCPFSEDEIVDILGNRRGHDDVAWYEAQRLIRKINLGKIRKADVLIELDNQCMVFEAFANYVKLSPDEIRHRMEYCEGGAFYNQPHQYGK